MQYDEKAVDEGRAAWRSGMSATEALKVNPYKFQLFLKPEATEEDRRQQHLAFSWNRGWNLAQAEARG